MCNKESRDDCQCCCDKDLAFRLFVEMVKNNLIGSEIATPETRTSSNMMSIYQSIYKALKNLDK